MTLVATTSQTVGPFFRIGLSHLCAACTYQEGYSGSAITISGQITDGKGLPVPDAQLEFWQADTGGNYPDTTAVGTEPRFLGFARVAVDEQGAFSLRTILPGAVVEADGSRQAPHIVVLVFLRGLLRHLITRIYFADQPSNHSDPVLQAVPEKRRETLIASADANAPGSYQWDIRLQGERETVFLAYKGLLE
jgi:protocatechuate 3,4-dioxygenase, alpha subunit